MSDFLVFRGASASITFAVVNADETPYDLTGATVLWRAKNSAGDLISKSTTLGITLDSPNTLGTGTISITPDDTNTWDEVTPKLRWSLDVTKGSVVYVVATGHMSIRPAITGVLPGVV